MFIFSSHQHSSTPFGIWQARSTDDNSLWGKSKFGQSPLFLVAYLAQSQCDTHWKSLLRAGMTPFWALNQFVSKFTHSSYCCACSSWLVVGQLCCSAFRNWRSFLCSFPGCDFAESCSDDVRSYQARWLRNHLSLQVRCAQSYPLMFVVLCLARSHQWIGDSSARPVSVIYPCSHLWSWSSDFDHEF